MHDPTEALKLLIIIEINMLHIDLISNFRLHIDIRVFFFKKMYNILPQTVSFWLIFQSSDCRSIESTTDTKLISNLKNYIDYYNVQDAGTG